MYRFLSTAGRKKLNLDAAGRIRNNAGSWDVLDADADASKFCCEPAEREVQVPLDVRVVRSPFRSARSMRTSTFIFLSTSCSLSLLV